MMNKKNLPHIITVVSFVVFIVLGLACASGPKAGGDSQLFFSINGGIGTVPAPQKVSKDASFTIPGGDGFSFGDAVFDGWYSYSDGKVTYYKVGESITPPGGYIALYAKWKLDAVDLESAKGLANKLVWLQNNAESNGNYTLELDSNESIGIQSLFYPGKDNITITLRGVGGNRIISSAVSNRIFFVPTGATLVLDNNITLQGHNDNKDDVVVYISGGKFKMNNGATITGNGGAGVDAYRGIFEMNGGSISGNRKNINARGGSGGVAVGGSFTMTDGTVSGNNGSGVYIRDGGSFIMNGGSITGNIREDGGTKTVISNSGSPLGNQFPYGGGGGIFVDNGGKFNMNNGTISGNKGGGVLVWDRGNFTMNGGTISGNTSRYNGGGVSVWENATFTKSGNSIIYGNDSGANSNTASTRNNSGHAVHWSRWVNDVYQPLYSNSTLGANQQISTSPSPNGTGW
jgi:hypothetical protein